MTRYYYSEPIAKFIEQSANEILGELVQGSTTVEQPQRDAWLEEISILKDVLQPYREQGKVYFEYSIPRLGKRIDVVVLIGPVVFVLEFKVHEEVFTSYALDQVWDYALDLKNFHEASHNEYIAPILIATKASSALPSSPNAPAPDKLLAPIKATPESLPRVIAEVLRLTEGAAIDPVQWESARYCPTPTIVEAAIALYSRHSVAEISRSDAAAINLTRTSDVISQIIRSSREKQRKSICFVTGVPGAGKTLVGLNIATEHIDKTSDLYSVFLSGNGPLVAILREALARDKVRQERERGTKMKKGTAMSEVKMFIQNVHNFRDDCLTNVSRPPIEHVALFDEAQRAWTLRMTSNFMLRKKGHPDFRHSEPEFLISCLDRHKDWAVIVCLVGGGQEINTGEAGITEWIDSLNRGFPEWDIHVSSRLTDSEYGAGEILRRLQSQPNVTFEDDLHLAVSMRSFRAEHVSLFVKEVLDIEEAQARCTMKKITDLYPIVITRELRRAKQWLKDHARGTERYGILASSEAQRLKPHAINVKSPMDPIHWFLDGKEDVRSSYYLEDVATEFQVQGLELDWACVTWDADFRYVNNDWQHWSFVGDRWNRINKAERKMYLKNAYRVLLTRARQGMVIFVPEGETTDFTRKPEYYDSTFKYLREVGIELI
ncbi:MAG: DUF2075 domain-containing protein [Terriglobales bacterium]